MSSWFWNAVTAIVLPFVLWVVKPAHLATLARAVLRLARTVGRWKSTP